ncbi:CAP domain-containing protein [Clostridium perfringens]|uniref:CAP domain-containing protein n=1 Tax=Clostridium perfringens TaxID=1502 RepID=UPI0013E300CD|nr:CAP domain-containing protein [Clostridium perfringens]MDB2069087.1 CAP domain-containing protein [Clostridium perfringens]MDK0562020.1 CAP domain-containing protein [Clostridium perfringens]MDK0706303.1 CAP domain-containing protein [Clostridium perfringens]MDM0492979.1 CAP domain-containing protein [Clostridium perfringens]MDU6016693.1 CAP domain-containing protein [Clostridium perfringens]
MSKILISILLSLGLCSGGVGVRYFNSNNISHKNVQANQSVSNESSEKVEAQQGEEPKEETNILSSNPFTKVFENISKNFSKDKVTDTTKKEESVKNTPQDEEAKVESNYENGKLEIIQSNNENKEVAQSNNEEANPSKDKQEEKPVENNKVEKETNKESMQKQENKPVENQVEKPVEQSNNSSSYIAQIEQMIFNKVNEERAKAGVAPLSYSNTMQKYARIKSEDMGVRKYFSHEDPNGQLITAKMKADGVSYNAWGENIAYLGGYSGDSNIANQFMTNWMNSSGHRANILSPNFTSIGVGVYKIGNTYYATQEFMK